MIPRRLDQVTRADIDALVSNAVSEGRTLDYKEQLPGPTDSDKKEFLRDVTAFANALGGDLIYGVREQRDAANKPTGIPLDAPGLAGENGDAAVRRLDSIIRTGVAPAIPGYQVQAFDGFPAGPVVVVRVPRSWAAPHMVTHGDSNQFWVRTSAQKQLMRVEEIRAAFTLQESLATRVRHFRDERLGRILAGDTPVPLMDTGRVVLHLVPVVALDGRPRVDLASLKQNSGIRPIYAERGWGTRFNLDGLLMHSALDPQETQGHTYLQVFRAGAIEAVEAFMLNARRDRKVIFPEVEQETLKALDRCLGFYRSSEIAPPIVVMLTLLGVRGFSIGDRPQWMGVRSTTVDRDALLLPDVLVEDLKQPADVILRPVLDALWQAAGEERCPHYGQDGRWKMPRS